MKAQVRKEQKERMKTSISNIKNNSSSENKSQDNNNTNNERKKKNARNRSAEMTKGFLSNESMPNSKNTQNNQMNPSLNQVGINPINQINQIDKEDNKEQDLSKIATMFNFEIDKEKDIIKIKENDEYYDMRNQIIQLEKELENTQKEYNTLLNQYEKKNELERQQINELESELKRHVDYDIEKLKKDNIILTREINLLDKKLDSVTTLFQKEQYDMSSTIFDLDNIIRKLKGELYFVDDLKMRLKNLTNKDIPQELVDSINYILKEDIAAQYKQTHTHSNKGSVRSRTGTIPIADILDTSSLDSKKSIKKLYI